MNDSEETERSIIRPFSVQEKKFTEEVKKENPEGNYGFIKFVRRKNFYNYYRSENQEWISLERISAIHALVVIELYGLKKESFLYPGEKEALLFSSAHRFDPNKYEYKYDYKYDYKYTYKYH